MDRQSLPTSILFVADGATSNENEVVTRCLCSLGWQYDVAADKDSALGLFNKKSYEIVLLSSNVAVDSGHVVLKALHASKPEQAVIVLMRSDNVSDILEFLRDGASDIVEQPVDSYLLEKSMKRVLSLMRQKEGDYGLYRFARQETTQFDFSSQELSRTRVPLLIADRLCKAGVLSLHDKLKLDLAFQEALTNSLDHGNLELESKWREIIDSEGRDRYSTVRRQRLDEAKFADRRVRVEINYDGLYVTITLEDEGPGFSASTENQVGTDGPLCHGRGLTIINAIMDQVQYEKSGSRLVMKKKVR